MPKPRRCLTRAVLALGMTLPLPAVAGPACPAPEAIAPADRAAIPPATTPATALPPRTDGARRIPYPRIATTEIAANAALRRIASHGATLYDLGSAHGLRGVFATKNDRFRVFYLTPDQQAVIGGIMWDAGGHDLTRDKMEPIDGTIPTVHWQPGPATASADQGPATAGGRTNAVTRLAASHFGIYGRDGAPRVYMVIDPLCPFSTRAFSALQGAVAEGRLQLAIVPIAINDYENKGASTPAALDLLSAPPQTMADVWRDISRQGHARPGHPATPDAPGHLQANLQAAHAIGMRGTPTLVWTDKVGGEHVEAGVPGDLATFLASLPS